MESLPDQHQQKVVREFSSPIENLILRTNAFTFNMAIATSTRSTPHPRSFILAISGAFFYSQKAQLLKK
jgi:hypothetical protein